MGDLLSAMVRSAVRQVIAGNCDALAKGALPRPICFSRAAEYLGVSERYLRQLVSVGVFAIVRHKPDGNKYLDRYDLESYIEGKKHGMSR